MSGNGYEERRWVSYNKLITIAGIIICALIGIFWQNLDRRLSNVEANVEKKVSKEGISQEAKEEITIPKLGICLLKKYANAGLYIPIIRKL